MGIKKIKGQYMNRSTFWTNPPTPPPLFFKFGGGRVGVRWSELRQGRSGSGNIPFFFFFFFFFFNFACDLSFLIKCEVSLLNVMVKE